MSGCSPYHYGAKKGLSTKDWFGIMIIILVIAAVGAGMAWYRSAMQSKVIYDSKSWCPTSGPFANTVLLIDLTDEISSIQEQKLKNFLRSSSDIVPKHAMLSVYLLSEDDGVQAPLVEICNPGNGEDINEFTGNPRLAKKRFNEKFLDPIEKAIKKIEPAKPARISPIIEHVRSIAVSVFVDAPREGYKHRLVVISDMLQNSEATSHYRDGQDWEKVNLGKLRADLDHVSQVDVKVFARNSLEHLQRKALIEYWENYFILSGSTLGAAERWAE